MAIRAGWRLASMFAAGLFVCLAQPSPTTAGTDNGVNSQSDSQVARVAPNRAAKNATRHGKSVGHRKASGQPALDGAEIQAANPTAIPPLVANSNAQLTPRGNPPVGIKAVFAQTNETAKSALGDPTGSLQLSEMQIVSADQLNDIDRALPEATLPAPKIAVASAEVPAPRLAPMMASSTEASTWDRTSIIGRFFIGLGALLTLASAARMFIA
jgi:hypothetical protein